jgi:hypothetical protein
MAFESPLTYVCFDLVTGAYLGRLPLAGVSFGSQLLQPGSLTGTIDLGDPAIQNLGPLGITMPARTLLCVDYLGALVWGGIVWTRDYKFDSVTRKMTVTATEIWSYFSSREQATDYSAPPFSGITGPSTEMAIWDASSAFSDANNVWDPMLIAWQILSDAMTQVPFGNLLAGMGIAANSFTTPSGYLASGTQTPTGDYLSINYPYSSLQQVSSMISQLAGNGLGVGFDYAVDVAYSGGSGSFPVATVNLSYPRRGRTYANNGLVLNCGQAISYDIPEDGTQAGNTIYEQGSSGSLNVSQNIQPLNGGYPIIEQIKSRANITSANMLAILAFQGASDLAVLSYPIATPTVTTDLFAGPIPLGQFVVGDDCRWLIPAMTGLGSVFDPRFPGGLDEEWRIIGWNATVSDSGQSTLVFTLSLPPSLSVGGPALP